VGTSCNLKKCVRDHQERCGKGEGGSFGKLTPCSRTDTSSGWLHCLLFPHVETGGVKLWASLVNTECGHPKERRLFFSLAHQRSIKRKVRHPREKDACRTKHQPQKNASKKPQEKPRHSSKNTPYETKKESAAEKANQK